MTLSETAFEIATFVILVNLMSVFVTSSNIIPSVNCYGGIDVSRYDDSNLNNTLQDSGIANAQVSGLGFLGVFGSIASVFGLLWNYLLYPTLGFGLWLNQSCYFNGALGYGATIISAICFLSYTYAVVYLIRGTPI